MPFFPNPCPPTGSGVHVPSTAARLKQDLPVFMASEKTGETSTPRGLVTTIARRPAAKLKSCGMQGGETSACLPEEHLSHIFKDEWALGRLGLGEHSRQRKSPLVILMLERNPASPRNRKAPNPSLQTKLHFIKSTLENTSLK